MSVFLWTACNTILNVLCEQVTAANAQILIVKSEFSERHGANMSACHCSCSCNDNFIHKSLESEHIFLLLLQTGGNMVLQESGVDVEHRVPDRMGRSLGPLHEERALPVMPLLAKTCCIESGA